MEELHCLFLVWCRAEQGGHCKDQPPKHLGQHWWSCYNTDIASAKIPSYPPCTPTYSESCVCMCARVLCSCPILGTHQLEVSLSQEVSVNCYSNTAHLLDEDLAAHQRFTCELSALPHPHRSCKIGIQNPSCKSCRAAHYTGWQEGLVPFSGVLGGSAASAVAAPGRPAFCHQIEFMGKGKMPKVLAGEFFVPFKYTWLTLMT